MLDPRVTAEKLERLEAENAKLRAALQKINDWLACAAIASAEDMAQSFETMQQIADAAIAEATEEQDNA